MKGINRIAAIGALASQVVACAPTVYTQTGDHFPQGPDGAIQYGPVKAGAELRPVPFDEKNATEDTNKLVHAALTGKFAEAGTENPEGLTEFGRIQISDEKEVWFNRDGDMIIKHLVKGKENSTTISRAELFAVLDKEMSFGEGSEIFVKNLFFSTTDVALIAQTSVALAAGIPLNAALKTAGVPIPNLAELAASTFKGKVIDDINKAQTEAEFLDAVRGMNQQELEAFAQKLGGASIQTAFIEAVKDNASNKTLSLLIGFKANMAAAQTPEERIAVRDELLTALQADEAAQMKTLKIAYQQNNPALNTKPEETAAQTNAARRTVAKDVSAFVETANKTPINSIAILLNKVDRGVSFGSETAAGSAAIALKQTEVKDTTGIAGQDFESKAKAWAANYSSEARLSQKMKLENGLGGFYKQGDVIDNANGYKVEHKAAAGGRLTGGVATELAGFDLRGGAGVEGYKIQGGDSKISPLVYAGIGHQFEGKVSVNGTTVFDQFSVNAEGDAGILLSGDIEASVRIFERVILKAGLVNGLQANLLAAFTESDANRAERLDALSTALSAVEKIKLETTTPEERKAIAEVLENIIKTSEVISKDTATNIGECIGSIRSDAALENILQSCNAQDLPNGRKSAERYLTESLAHEIARDAIIRFDAKQRANQAKALAEKALEKLGDLAQEAQEQSETITLNAPKVIGILVPPTGKVGNAFTFNASTAFAGAEGTYSATGLPASLSINAQTGVITGTPVIGNIGGHNITVTLTNKVGSVSSTTTININP